MADVIETAKSGRSNCRGCGRNIARGALRFGESLPNPYAEGESLFWFHLPCAACMRPDKFKQILENSSDAIPESEWLREVVRAGLEHERLVRLLRAERAPSGSAHCRHCRQPIGKGTWRFALQVFEEGRMQSIGSIHAECCEAYFGTREVMNRIERLTNGLSPAELAEIEARIQRSPARPLGATDLRG